MNGDLSVFEAFCGSALRHLNLRDNRIKGRCSEALWDLCFLQLEFLDLSGKNLIDQDDLLSCLSCLCGQKSAREGTGQTSWQAWNDICHRLKDLESIDLSGRNLPGNLAPFQNLKRLAYVDLSNNRFQGTLEPFDALPVLSFVNVSMNQLSGDLPMSLILLRMKSGPDAVRIEGNLGFSLPHDMSALPDPCQVDLSMCDLIGEAPIALLRLKLKWWCKVDLRHK